MAKTLTFEQIMALPLAQQVEAWAEYKLRTRLAEIKGMATALKLLQVERAAIKAAGFDIHPESLSSVFGEKATVRISSPSMEGESRLLKALLATGFQIEVRDAGSSYLALLRLKKGRLGIRMAISTAAAATLLDDPEQKEAA